MKKSSFFVLLLSFLLLFSACSQTATTQKTEEPAPTPTPTTTSYPKALQTPVESVPDKVLDEYEIDRGLYIKKAKERDPSFVYQYDPIDFIYEPEYGFYMPMTALGWHLKPIEVQGEYHGLARYDSNISTQLRVSVRPPIELPWLEISEVEHDVPNIYSVGIKYNYASILEHTPAHFQQYIHSLYPNVNVQTKQPHLVDTGYAVGGLVYYSGTIGDKTVEGIYAVIGHQLSYVQVMLITNEQFYGVAYEEVFFFLSHADISFTLPEQVADVRRELEPIQPKRWR